MTIHGNQPYQSTESSESNTPPTPLHKRDTAPTNRLSDLVLVLAGEDDATYETVRDCLETTDYEAFIFDAPTTGPPVEFSDTQPPQREPFHSLDFLDTVNYARFTVPVDPTATLTLKPRGESAAKALRAGLTDEQIAALGEATDE